MKYRVDQGSAATLDEAAYRASRDPHPLTRELEREPLEVDQAQGLELVERQYNLFELSEWDAARLEILSPRGMPDPA